MYMCFICVVGKVFPNGPRNTGSIFGQRLIIIIIVQDVSK